MSEEMKSAGIPAEHHEALAQAAAGAGISIATLIALILQYGPMLLEILKKLFPQPTPPAPSA